MLGLAYSRLRYLFLMIYVSNTAQTKLDYRNLQLRPRRLIQNEIGQQKLPHSHSG
jgi:hypothetical protein